MSFFNGIHRHVLDLILYNATSGGYDEFGCDSFFPWKGRVYEQDVYKGLFARGDDAQLFLFNATSHCASRFDPRDGRHPSGISLPASICHPFPPAAQYSDIDPNAET